MSTSLLKTVSDGFSDSDCCLYNITLDIGVPYIYLINCGDYNSEFEILLPDNLTTTLLKTYTIDGKTNYDIEISV